MATLLQNSCIVICSECVCTICTYTNAFVYIMFILLLIVSWLYSHGVWGMPIGTYINK